MAYDKAVDGNGLLYFWQKLKLLLAGKVDTETGKGLSTNDYTTEEKNKLASISSGANAYTHPTYTARTGKPTANATPAFGGTVTVSQIKSDATGHVTAATDRTITIPATVASSSAAGLMSSTDKAKLDEFGAASTYALKTDIAAAVNYKGTVATVSALPSSGVSTGDMYNVTEDGHNYVWDGSDWDDLGGTWRIEYLTNTEIDAIMAQ